MSPSGNTYRAFFLLLTYLVVSHAAMGKINGPAIDCLQNVTSFSYTGPSGSTVSSAQWTFGEGSNSNSISPKMIYKSTGYFMVRVKVTFSNSTTATDSHMIQIVGLPKAHYFHTAKTDSCMSKNQLCLKDTSAPAKPGQYIVRRLIVWGDGAFSPSSAPKYGDEICHHFNAPDKYMVKMEITDTYGCKSSQISYIHIVPQTKAEFSVTNRFKDCDTRELCIRNTSSGLNASSASYKWKINNSTDLNSYLSISKCFDFKTTSNLSISLLARDAVGCMDSIQKSYSIYIDPLPKSMQLQDTVLCYAQNTSNTASVQVNFYDQIVWNINKKGTVIGSTSFNFTPKAWGLTPGSHTINCIIIRGSCTTTLSRNFVVKGPVAGISAIGNNQCGNNRPVFFQNTSTHVDPKHTIYRWTIGDGPNKINPQQSGKPNDTNCLQGVNYKYKTGGTSNWASLWVKDTLTGCVDSTRVQVNLEACSPLLNISSLGFCQGDIFTRNPSATDPKYISLDTGKTWLKLPVTLNAPLNGTYDVGLIFEKVTTEWVELLSNGCYRKRKDSSKLRDTVFRKAFFQIAPYKKDQVSFGFYGRCSPFHLSVHFKSGMFYPGDKLEINWDDGTQYSKTFSDTTKIDSIFHVYGGKGGFNRLIRVLLGNKNSCGTDAYFSRKVGNIISLNTINSYYCSADTPLCFNPEIYDVLKQAYWKGNSPSNHVSWLFSDTVGVSSQFAPCHLFSKKGMQVYKMIVHDSSGCRDTFTDSLFIQDLRANAKSTSREIYCSELKQFFDSSSSLFHKKDSIIKYVWDFGTGTFTTPLKDPFKSLNTAAEFITVTHAVETVLGCVDTIRFQLRIIGSHPYFRITDTIGCDSLQTSFINLSRTCKGYIWEFGDTGQTSYATETRDPTSFKYLKPGRYHIRLYGYDSIYNPATKAVYFCNNIFPDPLYQKDSIRSVLVLPSRSTGILSRDTVCRGSKLEFTSLSDTSYDKDVWMMGDQTMYTSKRRDTVSHTYMQTGSFQVRLKPSYSIAAYNQCSDSASKTITVLGVDADFSIESRSQAPVFYFLNKSTPASAALYWDFGQASAGSRNHSSEQNPMHHYGLDTGSYQICLVARLPFGCADTTCKDIYNDYLPGFLIPNVFTPGNTDGKNDVYDIIIQGETEYHLKIFDRWGVLVYEGFEDGDHTNNINWNGKVMNSGNNCPSGTYYYLFDYRLRSEPGQLQSTSGVITLIR